MEQRESPLKKKILKKKVVCKLYGTKGKEKIGKNDFSSHTAG